MERELSNRPTEKRLKPFKEFIQTIPNKDDDYLANLKKLTEEYFLRAFSCGCNQCEQDALYMYDFYVEEVERLKPEFADIDILDSDELIDQDINELEDY